MVDHFKAIKSTKDVIHNEKFRYSIKGLHLVIAAVQTFIFFYYVPECISFLWKVILPLGSWDNIFCVVTILLPIISYAITNGIYCLIYVMKSPYLEKYRVQNQAWPWEKSDKEWKEWRSRLIYFAIMNMVVCNVGLVLLQYFSGVEHFNYRLESLPSKFDNIWQIVFFMLCDDFFFYFTHRLFHCKSLYRFHKIHHEHNVSTCFSNLQTHFVDYLFSNVVSVVSGFLILGSRVHYTTYILWNIWRIMETCDGHSGYEFPWSMFRLLPFSGSSDYHNFHHSKNVGNYSSFFTYLDTLLNTNKDYYKFKELQSKKKIDENDEKILEKQIF